jgi:hypothetical protein
MTLSTRRHIGFLATLAFLLSAGLTAVLGLFSPAPAEAAVTQTIRVCNDYDSVDDIQGYTIFGPYSVWNINQGECKSLPDSYGGTGNRIRVDVDVEGHEGDVDSYWKVQGVWTVDGGVWDPNKVSCINGENSRSDPWSTYDGIATTYDTNGVSCPS